MKPVYKRVISKASHRVVDYGIRVKFLYHLNPSVAGGNQRVNIESGSGEAGDYCIHVFPVSFHWKVYSRYQKNFFSTFIVYPFPFEVSGNLFFCWEVFSVFPVVIHILKESNRWLSLLDVQTCRFCQCCNVVYGIPVIVLAWVSEIFQQHFMIIF